MTTRTREWTKFGVLVSLALVLALAFAAAVDFPRTTQAQQRPVSLQISERPVANAAQPVIDLSNAFAAVVEAVRPSVVSIRAERRVEPRARRQQRLPAPFDEFFPNFPTPEDPGIRRGQGSGFIISDDGYILTNNHVVEDADRIRVTLLDKREFPADLVGRDPDTDVAVIKIAASDLRAVSFGNSDSLRIGEWVLAVGNPLDFAFTVTAGIVSAKGRGLAGLQAEQQYRIHDFIQTDAAINPGNSGGPLVNVHGQVVGINSAIASPTGYFQGYGFAIPVNLARTVTEQLITHGKVTRAILGVSIRDADPEDAAYVGLQSIRGVVVTGYSGDNSPAKAAGIQPGDVIVEVDGQPVEYGAQLQALIGFKRPGQQARITVVRKGGERHTHAVRLTAREEATERVASSGRDASANRRPHEVKLGITIEPVSQEVAARAQLNEEHRGLLITSVDPEGPASDKLLPQLIITHVNGQRVRTVSELETTLTPVKSGDVVELRLYSVRQSQANLVRLRAGG